MTVKGLNDVLKNVQREFENMSRKTERAVYEILQTGKALADTYTPVDTSNLLNSGYAPVVYAEDGKVTGFVGYTAKYAGYVHEMPGTLMGQPRAHFGKTREGVEFGGGSETGNYWGPDGKPQFLSVAFAEIKNEVPGIIKNAYRR